MRSITFTNSLGASITIGPDTDYIITSLSGIETAPLDLQTTKAPFQDGTTLIDQLLEPRTMVVEGAIAIPKDLSAIATRRRALQTTLNPKLGPGTLTLTTDHGTKSISAVAAACSLPNKLFSEPYQRFQLEFYSPLPFFTDTTGTTIDVSYVSSYFGFAASGFAFAAAGITLGSTGGVGGQTVDIDITGDVSSPLVVRFVGPATNPKILNQTTGEYIRCEIELIAGEYIEVNTAFGAKNVMLYQGSVLSNGMAYLDILTTFFQMIPGINRIAFYEEGTLPGSYAVITYRNQFVGV